MNLATAHRPLGPTGLEVTGVCVGGGPLGSMPQNFGYETSWERGVETAVTAFCGPFNFIDTSNNYSAGESERRIGAGLRQIGGLPEGYVLATKLDRDPETGDFSGAQMHRSLEQSLERLGVDRVDLLYIHNPEHVGFDRAMAPGGPVEALVGFKETGTATNIGIAGGPVDMMQDFVRTGVFDAILTHNRYTLVDRSAERLITLAAERGVGVVNAAVFGGGVLARGLASGARYGYQDASSPIIEAIKAIESDCARFNVPLAAAALQFSLRDDRVGSTVVGFSRPGRLEEIVALAQVPIPDELWGRLQAAAAPREAWLW